MKNEKPESRESRPAAAPKLEEESLRRAFRLVELEPRLAPQSTSAVVD